MIDTAVTDEKERALLVGLERDGVDKWDLKESLEELAELASSAGAEVVGIVTQKLDRPTAPYYIGKGKAEQVAEQCRNEQHQLHYFRRRTLARAGPQPGGI